uniref:Deoxynucleotidyltransferase terminal-interacting protein 1 n=1 Tax=Malurus cyaneus samueli TaxID=2593467 RepID=A0A8C5TMG0_9PASS
MTTSTADRMGRQDSRVVDGGAGWTAAPGWAPGGGRVGLDRAGPVHDPSTRSFTDPSVSMDLLRAVLQPSINEEIRGVFNKYMKFFQTAAINVRDNVGEEVDPEQLIQETCRSCLEQVGTGQGVSSCLGEGGLLRGFPQAAQLSYRKISSLQRKGRPPGQSLSNDRGVSGMAAMWDPSRLTETTTFVLGSRGGGPRQEPVTLLPSLRFFYAADPQDKHWLTEQQHMRAIGGKMAYLLIEEDIRDLAASEDYRDSVDLRLEELKPFIPPAWMTEKMQKHMETLRRGGDVPPPEGPPEP